MAGTKQTQLTRSDGQEVNYTDPIRDAEDIDVSAVDVTPTNGPCRAVMVGTSGDLEITLVAGTKIVLHDLAAGIWHPMEVTKFWNANTTATDIIAGW